MLKLYSKDTLVSSINAMKQSGRLAHAFLLTGEKGVGKKIAAKYIAMTILCENGNACGECRGIPFKHGGCALVGTVFYRGDQR